MNNGTSRRVGSHDNAFGFIRLLLASLVIVSHTPELADGDRHRELLTGLFHTISFGEFAVSGFFVVSGFLITGSFLRTPAPGVYLRHRIARIYPAFVLSSLLCVFVLAPNVGGRFEHDAIGTSVRVAARIAILSPPYLPGAFAGTPYPLLNGAAWTIQYEFLMYLAVLGLGLARLLRFPVIAAAAAICLLASAFAPRRLDLLFEYLPIHQYVLVGTVRDLFRLFGTFLVGAAFRMRREWITPSVPGIAVAVALACVCLLFPWSANAGVAVCGGYAMLATAMAGGGTFLARVNNRNDISYGLYLYGWPAGKLILWWGMWSNLLWVGVATWIAAAAAGAASWFLVERPINAWARRPSARSIDGVVRSVRTGA